MVLQKTNTVVVIYRQSGNSDRASYLKRPSECIRSIAQLLTQWQHRKGLAESGGSVKTRGKCGHQAAHENCY